MKYCITESNFENFLSNNKISAGILYTDDYIRGLDDFDIYIPYKIATIKLWELHKCKIELERVKSFKINVMLENWLETGIEFEFSNYETWETGKRELLICYQNYKIKKIKSKEKSDGGKVLCPKTQIVV